MKKLEVMRLAHKSRLIYTRSWLMRAFSIPYPTDNEDDTAYENMDIESRRLADPDVFALDTTDPFYSEVGYYAFNFDQFRPGYIRVLSDGKCVVLNTEYEFEAIEDHKKGSEVFSATEAVKLKKGDYPVVDRDMDTFYSTLVTNFLVWEYAFGKKVPYTNAQFKPKTIDAYIAGALKSGEITVAEYRDHTKGLGMMTCLLAVCVPSATPKSATGHPDRKKLRTKLLKENADKLSDPATMAKIEMAMVAQDKEYLKGDPSDRFYTDKQYAVARKRMYGMFGGEPDIMDPTKYNLASRSLEEGIEAKDLPMMINSLRMGSYMRGTETANGGQAAKLAARLYQNTKLEGEDCKSTYGVLTYVTPYNLVKLKGRYVVSKGKTKPIGDTKALLGKYVYLRAPPACKVKHGNYCPICMGDAVTESKVGLGPQASAVGSELLGISLALFHGRKMSTVKYQPEWSIQ